MATLRKDTVASNTRDTDPDTSKATTKPASSRARKTLSHGLDRMRLADDDRLGRGSSASSEQDNSNNDMGRASRTRRGTNLAGTPLDEEGTTDVWRVAIEKFARGHGGTYDLEDDITEEDSVDWVSEQDILAVSLTKLEGQHAFVPRVGELVLWIANFSANSFLLRHPQTKEYRYYSFKTKRFGEFPEWRAGVVSTTPTGIAKNGHVDFNDLLDAPIKKTSLTTSGFRVETMPDPNAGDKSWSKQYKYVPLRNIRPLSQWQLVLNGIEQEEFHPSILNALTCMTTISLVGKWFFRSGWPHGTVLAKSAYVASELLTVGDVVRLMPARGQACTDVMVIESIRYHIRDMDVPFKTQDTTRLCVKSFVTIFGSAYTVDEAKAQKYVSDQQHNLSASRPQPLTLEEVITTFRPVGTSEYGTWYPLHSSGQRLEVSHEKILGRLCEADAVRLWLGQPQSKTASSENMKPSLSYDVSSVLAGRHYASKIDERLVDSPVDRPDEIQWLLSDSRAEALDIATFNGQEVYPYHEIRDVNTVQAWRTHLKYAQGKINLHGTTILSSGRRSRKTMIIYDDEGNPIETKGYYIPELNKTSTSEQDGLRRRGRKAGSKLIGGKVYQASELLAHPELLEQLRAEQTQNGKLQEQSETPSRRRLQASSQMAGAAIESSSDSMEVTEDDEDVDEAEETREIQVVRQNRNADRAKASMHGNDSVPDEDLGQAYGINSDTDSDSDFDDNDEVSDTNEGAGETISALIQSQNPRKNMLTSMGPKLARSVEIEMTDGDGHAGSLEQEDDTEEEEFDLEEWKNPRNARGGTVESRGGDYRSSQ